MVTHERRHVQTFYHFIFASFDCFLFIVPSLCLYSSASLLSACLHSVLLFFFFFVSSSSLVSETTGSEDKLIRVCLSCRAAAPGLCLCVVLST